MTHTLNKVSRKLVENAVGLTYDKVENYDAITIDNEIEKRTKKNLKHIATKVISSELLLTGGRYRVR